MKPLYNFVASVGILFMSACSTTNNTTSTDDVYYSKNDKVASAPKPVQSTTSTTAPSQGDYDYAQDNSQAQPSSTTTTQDADGNTYITNNYYNADDYYDYAYSARLRRFYSPVSYNYYDPFYTNMYWYDYRPASWGVSIYLGYNWWAPSYCYYDPFWYGPGYGWYDPYWHPYHGYWNPYNAYNYGYWNGYNDGYWNGYYHGGYNPYYYNSYDATSYNGSYYGPRGSMASNGRGTTASTNPRTLGERYQQAVAENTLPTMNTGKPVSNPRESTLAPTTRPVQGSSPRLETGTPSSIGNNTKPSTASPRQGPISIQNGGTKPVNETGGTKPVRNGNVDLNQTGGTKPMRNDNLDQTGGTKPIRNEDVRPTTKPVEQPSNGRNNPVIIRDNSNDRVEPTTKPRDFNNSRNEPRIEVPKVEPKTRNETPRVFERSRSNESQPRFEQRNEPRQFKQESAPREQRSEPSRPSNNNNNSGGRRR